MTISEGKILWNTYFVSKNIVVSNEHLEGTKCTPKKLLWIAILFSKWSFHKPKSYFLKDAKYTFGKATLDCRCCFHNGLFVSPILIFGTPLTKYIKYTSRQDVLDLQICLWNSRCLS